MSLTPFEVATWLFNPNGFGATDEEFAETFVLAYKIWKEGYGVDGRLTVEDMYKYDTQEIADCLQRCLHEIIYDEDVDESAWWKRDGKPKQEFWSPSDDKQQDFEIDPAVFDLDNFF